jgi:hypothetical protein
MADLFEDVDMRLAVKFKDRAKGKALEERRNREARVVPRIDRVRTSGLQLRTAALNQKVTPEEKHRYHAYAKSAGVTGPDFLSMLLDAWQQQHNGGKQ